MVSLNGVKVNNLAGLVAAVDGCTAPFLDFQLDYNLKVCVT